MKAGVYAIALNSDRTECRIYVRRDRNEAAQLNTSLQEGWHVILVGDIPDRAKVNGCLQGLETKLTEALKTKDLFREQEALSEMEDYFKTVF